MFCANMVCARNVPRRCFSLWRGSMALGSQPRWTVRPADTAVGIDVGLREYMLRVYNYMASGLALTGIVAYVAAASGFIRPDHAHAADVAGHSGAARARDADELWRQQDAGEHLAARLLGLCGADGPVAGGAVPRLYRREHRAGVLHHRRHLLGDEPLRLHDQARPDAVRLVSVHGADRHHHRIAGQHVCRLDRRCNSRSR